MQFLKKAKRTKKTVSEKVPMGVGVYVCGGGYGCVCVCGVCVCVGGVWV